MGVVMVVVLMMMMMGSGGESSFDFKEAELENDATLWKLYTRWQLAHSISRSQEEKEERFEHFKESARRVHAFNKQPNESYTMGLNMFSDMTSEELKGGGDCVVPNINDEEVINSTGRGTSFMYQNVRSPHSPSSIDWRKKGAVVTNFINNNNKCGSCWAIAAAGAVEGINQITTKKLVSLSPQELVDCVGGISGCNGGLSSEAFKFIMKYGLTTNGYYRYNDEPGMCQYNKVKFPAARIGGYKFVPPNNEYMLMKAVSEQPVAVLMNSTDAFKKYYKSGVFTGPCEPTQNHAVLIVGYGRTVTGVKYWIVKNSWGIGWGEQGFFKIKMGVCGIAMKPVYPLKKLSTRPPSQAPYN